MSINTQSYFHYGIEFTRECNKIDIQLSTFEFVTLTFDPGSYCPSDLVNEMKLQFEGLDLLSFVVSFDRATCRFTIETTDATTFRIGFVSGPNRECEAWKILGFEKDVAALYTTSITAEKSAGTKYTPQFFLQDYLDCDTNLELVDATVNTSSSGKCEVLYCREDRFIEFSMKFISNIPSNCRSYITDLNGVENAAKFLAWALCRKCIEFVPDCTKPDEYYEIKVSSVPGSRNATSFRMRKMFRNIGCENDYYRTGILRFRVLNKDSIKDNT